MEKIIIWIVLIVGAAVYEFIKKKYIARDSDTNVATENSHAPNRGRTRNVTPPRPAMADTGTGADTGLVPAGQAERASRPMPPRPARESRYRQLPPEGECSIPDHHLHEDDEEQRQATMTGTAEEKARAAHYARWRQAILDTQILERKF